MHANHPPALSTSDDVIALADGLSQLADKLHAALRRLTAKPSGDTSIAYALLTEEYALRARTNILRNDAPRHTIDGLEFSQASLINALSQIEANLHEADTLEVVRSIVSDLITLASSINPGKTRVVNFLAKELGVQG